MTARKLSEWFEKRQLEKGGEGLYRMRFGGQLALEKVDDAVVDGDGPILLFLHGTASSTARSFGGLWQPAEGAATASSVNASSASNTAR